MHTAQSRYFSNSPRILRANFLVLHLTIFELPYKLEVIVCRELPSENKGPARGWQYGTIRYASIFAKKYGTLIWYAFFVMVRVRYVGTVRFFCNGTGTVRWYAV